MEARPTRGGREAINFALFCLSIFMLFATSPTTVNFVMAIASCVQDEEPDELLFEVWSSWLLSGHTHRLYRRRFSICRSEQRLRLKGLKPHIALLHLHSDAAGFASGLRQIRNCTSPQGVAHHSALRNTRAWLRVLDSQKFRHE